MIAFLKAHKNKIINLSELFIRAFVYFWLLLVGMLFGFQLARGDVPSDVQSVLIVFALGFTFIVLIADAVVHLMDFVTDKIFPPKKKAAS